MKPPSTRRAARPLKPELDRIAAITTKDQLVETIAYLQSLGVQALFNFGASPDLHNASMEIANIAQGGLGLPDRDYYSDTDAKSTGNTREISGAREPRCLCCWAMMKPQPRKKLRP